MKNLKYLLIINSIMLVLALYTFISLYEPSLLHFIDSDYVDGVYVPKGGDYLTEELFLGLFHYLNLIGFLIFNIAAIYKNYKSKYYKKIMVSVLALLILLAIHTWSCSVRSAPFQVEEIG